MKPDYSKGTTIHGGEIGALELRRPFIRRFPHKGIKRRVDVHIESFVGVCAFARHYVAVIEEEKNPVWNGEAWQAPYGDLEGYGVHIRSPRFTSEKAAREFIQWHLRAFDPAKYEFVYNTYEKPPRWFYAREGD